MLFACFFFLGGVVVVIRVSRREGLLIQAFSPSCVRLALNAAYSHFQVALVLYNQAGNTVKSSASRKIYDGQSPWYRNFLLNA